MAVINPTINREIVPDGSVLRVIWSNMLTGDTGAPISLPSHSDRSVQVFGTFGGATCTIEGSNDGGTTYAALTNTGGTSLAILAAALHQVLQITQVIRPNITGGAAASITVAMIVRLSINPRA